VSFVLFTYKICKYRLSKAHLCVLKVSLCIYRVFGFFRCYLAFFKGWSGLFWLWLPSELQALTPYLVDDVLRMRGRLQNAPLPNASKHPILLPSKHPVTDLLILMYHTRDGHMGSLHVLTAMKREYWIMKGVSTWRKHCGLVANAGTGEQRLENNRWPIYLLIVSLQANRLRRVALT